MRSSKEAALDALETDSAITSTSFQHDDGMYLESEGSEKYGQSRGKVSIYHIIFIYSLSYRIKQHIMIFTEVLVILFYFLLLVF